MSHEYLKHNKLTSTVKITFANNPQFNALYFINCKSSSFRLTDVLWCKLWAIETKMSWTYSRHWTNGMNSKQYIWDIFRETNYVETKRNITLSHIPYQTKRPMSDVPDSKVHVANIGPTWVLSSPDRPHDGPMNLAIRGYMSFDIMCCDNDIPNVVTLISSFAVALRHCPHLSRWLLNIIWKQYIIVSILCVKNWNIQYL